MVRLMRMVENAQPHPAFAVTDTPGGEKKIGVPDDCNVTLHALRLIEAFASASPDFVNDRLGDIATYHRAGFKGGNEPTPVSVAAGVAFVRGGNPTDTVQSTLLVQMAATHDAALRALGALGRVTTTPQMNLFGNLSTKLLNTYTRQAEVLSRLQRGGEQVIKHVHIDNRGGQAVVTDTVLTGGASVGSRDQAFGLSALGPAMLGENPIGQAVPMPRDEGKEAVPDSWRRAGEWGTEG